MSLYVNVCGHVCLFVQCVRVRARVDGNYDTNEGNDLKRSSDFFVPQSKSQCKLSSREISGYD